MPSSGEDDVALATRGRKKKKGRKGQKRSGRGKRAEKRRNDAPPPYSVGQLADDDADGADPRSATVRITVPPNRSRKGEPQVVDIMRVPDDWDEEAVRPQTYCCKPCCSGATPMADLAASRTRRVEPANRSTSLMWQLYGSRETVLCIFLIPAALAVYLIPFTEMDLGVAIFLAAFPLLFGGVCYLNGHGSRFGHFRTWNMCGGETVDSYMEREKYDTWDYNTGCGAPERYHFYPTSAILNNPEAVRDLDEKIRQDLRCYPCLLLCAALPCCSFCLFGRAPCCSCVRAKGEMTGDWMIFKKQGKYGLTGIPIIYSPPQNKGGGGGGGGM
jgi:hypothetical protein